MSDWTTLFDGQLEVTPPLGEELLSQIPARRGVLALLAEGDKPILLLTAADIRSRLRTRLAQPAPEERKKTADLREITRKILWKLSLGHFETDLNFFELARQIWPASFAELLSWKMAWFVHVDCQEEFPHFVRTREVLTLPGLYVGPFESGRSADKFIEAIEDAFDLCRNYACLRQSPHGQPCAYLQMGRCVGPCNGTVSMERYRQLIAEAALFASGDRGPMREKLHRKMKDAAAELKFEQAAAVKARLARLEFFERDEYRHAQPAENFRFVLAQRGRGKKIDVFVVNFGQVVRVGPVDCPPKDESLAMILSAMAGGPAVPATLDDEGRYRMGLLSHYLFSGQERRGVIVRYREGLTKEELASALAALADAPPPATTPTEPPAAPPAEPVDPTP